MMNNKISRIVNINFTCDGLNFDAAIDCDWFIHAYDMMRPSKVRETPIELFCYSHPEWDIKMIYYKNDEMSNVNSQQTDGNEEMMLHTFCDFDEILAAAREWIKEMKE